MDCELSVIIATYKRPDLLKWCLNGVVASLKGFTWECLVVGQGSDVDTKPMVEDCFGLIKEIRYLHSELTGAAPAREFGSRQAKGRILAYLDDDASPAVSWGGALLDALPSGDKDIAMACGPLRPKWDGERPNWYPKEREFLLGLYDIGEEVRLMPSTDLPIGANMAIRRNVFVDIGGFDIEIGFSEGRGNPLLAGEDSLIGIRAREAGYSIRYHPDMIVQHFVRDTKLRVGYFLNRHFWEGITAITLLTRSQTFSGKGWLKSALAQFYQAFLKFIGALFPITNRGQSYTSKVMLFLSEMLYHVGAGSESLRMIFQAKKRDE